VLENYTLKMWIREIICDNMMLDMMYVITSTEKKLKLLKIENTSNTLYFNLLYSIS